MLFVGDDWAEDHHDVELVDELGRRLAKARLPEGIEGITRLHALIAEHLPVEWAGGRGGVPGEGWHRNGSWRVGWCAGSRRL